MKNPCVRWLARGCVGLLLCCGLVSWGTGTAVADPILPGFDFFITDGDGSTSVDLGMGPIALEGVPLPFTMGGVDTIVARMDPGPPEGMMNIIDIEIVALHLRSIQPIEISPSQFADLHVTIDAGDRFFTGMSPMPMGDGTGPTPFNLPVPVAVPPSVGKMEIMHDPPGAGHMGAMFRACFGDPGGCDASGPNFGQGLGMAGSGIFADLIFVIPGGDPANPADVLQAQAAPEIVLSSNGKFVHSPQFAAGGVVISQIQHMGPHPPRPGGGVMPEPASFALVALAAVAMGLVRRRRLG